MSVCLISHPVVILRHQGVIVMVIRVLMPPTGRSQIAQRHPLQIRLRLAQKTSPKLLFALEDLVVEQVSRLVKNQQKWRNWVDFGYPECEGYLVLEYLRERVLRALSGQRFGHNNTSFHIFL